MWYVLRHVVAAHCTAAMCGREGAVYRGSVRSGVLRAVQYIVRRAVRRMPLAVCLVLRHKRSAIYYGAQCTMRYGAVRLVL